MPFRAYTDEERLKKFHESYTVNPETGCWEWNRLKNLQGYGQFSAAGKGSTKSASRWSHIRFIGPIPEGYFVCHKCDNPPCVNPEHLFAATQRVNMQDCVEKGRFHWKNKTHCPRGHEYTPENTSVEVQRGGYQNRICKQCRRIRAKKRSALLSGVIHLMGSETCDKGVLWTKEKDVVTCRFCLGLERDRTA